MQKSIWFKARNFEDFIQNIKARNIDAIIRERVQGVFRYQSKRILLHYFETIVQDIQLNWETKSW